MATTTSTLATLIPIISGGAIGFLASFATSHFGHNRAQKALEEERTRERLEDFYLTLMQISRMATEQYGNAISHVHYSQKIEQREAVDFPPHGKLKMLVGLYFKDLAEVHEKFSKAQEKFTLKYIEIATNDFSSKSLKEKQSICSDLTNLDIALEKTITEIQNKISAKIKI